MTRHDTHTLFVTDRKWHPTLYAHLRQSGFSPLFMAVSGDSALDHFYQNSPRLVLIDQHLADCNAIDLCGEMLTAQSAVKIVLLAESDDQLPLTALHAGVAGCINYNFPVAEWPGVLIYVLNGGMAFNRNTVVALLAQAWTPQKRDPVISIGPLRIDLVRHLVIIAGRRIQLTPREFELLVCLARNIDRVVTFDQLLNEAWGYHNNDGTPAQVRLYIARLRGKLMGESKIPDFILTERGIGYRLYSEALRRGTLYPPPLAPTGDGYYTMAALAS
jgi:DNA-binding response OmpR family regulator